MRRKKYGYYNGFLVGDFYHWELDRYGKLTVKRNIRDKQA